MNKRIMTILIFVLFLFSTKLIQAQDEKLDSLDFTESTPMKESKPPYFSIAGGYLGTFIYINFDGLNKQISDKNFGLGQFKAPMYLSGAEGFTAIGIVPNLRLGFFGMGGTSTLKKTLMIDSQNINRSLDYSLSFTGLAVDYAFTPIKSLAIIPGINLGWGTLTIDNYQTKDNFNWTDFGDTLAMGKNYYNQAKTVFTFVQPNVNVEYAITPFTAIRLSIGYAYSFSIFSNDWKWYYDNNAVMTTPTNVKASGLSLQFGVFVGLFNY